MDGGSGVDARTSVLDELLQVLRRFKKSFKTFSVVLILVRRLLGITGEFEDLEAQVFVGASV